MPADILRDREVNTPTPQFADLAASVPTLAQRQAKLDADLEDAKRVRDEASAAEQAARTRQQERVEPMVAKAQKTLAAPQEEPPQPPQLTPPPSRGLSDFLSSHQGESPENTITKLIQGIGLMAAGITGMRHGDARGALAGLHGALQGWQEGDRQRADRYFADWKAKTDNLLTDHQLRVDRWKELQENRRLTVDQMLKAIELEGIASGYDVMAAAAKKQDANVVVKEFEVEQGRLLTLADHSVRLQVMADERAKDREWKERYGMAMLQARQANQGQQFPDAAIDVMAQTYIATRQMPAFGMMSTAGRIAFWSKVAQLAPMYGGVEGIVARQNAIAGLRQEGAAVMKTRGLVEAFSETAKKNLKDAEKISNELDRDGSPMLNKWLLKGRKAWSGDSKVTDFDVAVRTAINETARVLNSANASGVLSDSARHEIEDMLSTALNREQFTAAVQRLLKEMENRRGSYDDQVKAIHSETERMAGPTLGPGKTMLIRRKAADGKWQYAEGPVGAVPDGWERYENAGPKAQ